MRHRIAGKKLDRRTEERTALARNLTSALFERFGQEREFIVTTITKAKWVRPFVERSITLGIKGYRELQKAADANNTSIAELRRQQNEEKKKFKDLPPRVREHLARSIHFRRMLTSRLRNPDAVRALFDRIAPRYLERPGGYLRVLRLGERRLGDAGEKAILQFVEGPKTEAPAQPQA